MNGPLFSIIIPTYHGADSLFVALESINRQTYKNIEVIVSDDNGIGTIEQVETKKTVDYFLDKLNIKYLINKHVNGSYARNRGLEIAKGKYISFLDDDDFYLREYVEMAIKELEKDKCKMVFFNVAHIAKENFYRIVKNDVIDSKNLIFMYTEIGTGSNICFDKIIYEEDGGFDERYIRHQDIEFVAKKLSKYSSIWIDSVQIVKYYNSIENYPDYKKGMLMQELLRNDMYERSILNNRDLFDLKERQLHALFNDMLVKNSRKEDIKTVFKILKKANTAHIVDYCTYAVYCISPSLFNFVFRLLAHNNVSSDDHKRFQYYIKYRNELKKQ